MYLIEGMFSLHRIAVPMGKLHAGVYRAKDAGATHWAVPCDGGAQGLLRVRLPLVGLRALQAALQRALQAAHPHARPLGRKAKQVHGKTQTKAN